MSRREFYEDKDIGLVNAGQEVAVKVEIFQCTEFGSKNAQCMFGPRCRQR